jgi:hypothetical protein
LSIRYCRRIKKPSEWGFLSDLTHRCFVPNDLLVTVLRQVERNAVRAELVVQAED